MRWRGKRKEKTRRGAVAAGARFGQSKGGAGGAVRSFYFFCSGFEIPGLNLFGVGVSLVVRMGDSRKERGGYD